MPVGLTILELLPSHLSSHNERVAFVATIFSALERDNLDYSGSPLTFTELMLRRAEDYGRLDTLIDHTKEMFGTDVQERLENERAALHEWATSVRVPLRDNRDPIINQRQQYLYDLISALKDAIGDSVPIDLTGELHMAKGRKSGSARLSRKDGLDKLEILDTSSEITGYTADSSKSIIIPVSQATSYSQRLVIVGEPGSGKTTSIRQVALRFAEACLANPDNLGGNPLPVFVHLAGWDDENIPFSRFVYENVPFEVNRAQSARVGEFMFFLDGLNELGGNISNKAGKIREWLHSSEHYPKCVIVTCRERDYFGGGLELDLDWLRIQALSDDQITEFVHAHLADTGNGILTALLPKTKDSGVEARHLYHLAKNPYFLYALIIVFRRQPSHALPRNSGLLSKALIEAVWNREENAGRIQIGRFEQSQHELARLAFAMIDAGLPTRVSREYATLFVSEETLEAAASATLIQLEQGSASFYHQLMQEYFAAIGLRHIGLQHIDYSDTAGEGASWFFNLFGLEGSSFDSPTKWEQVVVALCGIANDAESLVSQIAERRPLLAIRCLRNGVDVPASVVLEQAKRNIESPDKVIRGSSALALGSIPDASNAQYVIGLLDDPDAEVQEAAMRSLAALGESANDVIVSYIENNHKQADKGFKLLVRQGIGATPILMRLVQNGNPLIRKEAIRGLGAIYAVKGRSKVTTPEALVDIVIQALSDDDSGVRWAALQHLEANPVSRAAESVAHYFLESINEAHWRTALKILQRMKGKPRHINALVGIYRGCNSRSSRRRAESRQSLWEQFGVEGVLRILRCYGRTWEVSDFLQKMDMERCAFEVGLASLAPVTRGVFCDALKSDKHSHHCDLLLPMVNDQSAFVRGLAIRSLGAQKQTTAITAIANRLNDNAEIYSNSKELVSTYARNALQAIGTEEALQAIAAVNKEANNSRPSTD